MVRSSPWCSFHSLLVRQRRSSGTWHGPAEQACQAPERVVSRLIFPRTITCGLHRTGWWPPLSCVNLVLVHFMSGEFHCISRSRLFGASLRRMAAIPLAFASDDTCNPVQVQPGRTRRPTAQGLVGRATAAVARRLRRCAVAGDPICFIAAVKAAISEIILIIPG